MPLALPGQYNDLATAYLALPDETIKHIFSLGRLSPKYEVCEGGNCYFTLRSLFILTVSYLGFMVLLGGIVVPGGLFMPSIMVPPPPRHLHLSLEA
jgi:chloride channel 7